jgi:hypothetical protein
VVVGGRGRRVTAGERRGHHVDGQPFTAHANRDRPLGCRGMSGGRVSLDGHQGGGVEVVEVETELLLPILRVQRRGATDGHGGQKDQGHRRAVGQHDGDPVAWSEAGIAQLFGQPIYLAAQRWMIHDVVMNGQ